MLSNEQNSFLNDNTMLTNAISPQAAHENAFLYALIITILVILVGFFLLHTNISQNTSQLPEGKLVQGRMEILI